jgi:hypothetical protein
MNYHNSFRAVFEPRPGETALPVHVVDPIETVGLQPTSDATENKKVSSIHVFSGVMQKHKYMNVCNNGLVSYLLK